MGIYVVGQVGGKWKYVNFEYINVISEVATTSPAPTVVKGEHPVIQGINGPTSITQITSVGSAHYSLQITGGKAPYKVTWQSDSGVIFSGTSYQSADIPINRLRWNGEGYWIYIMVEDSTGEEAAWVDNVGISHTEFVYGVTGSAVVTQPTFPYKAFGAK